MIRPALVILLFSAMSACSPTNSSEYRRTEIESGSLSTEAPSADDAFDTVAWLRENHSDDGPIMFREGRADLDGDGKDEIFVFTAGPMMCGTGGCPLTVLRRTDGGVETLASTTVTQLPVGVLDSSTDGMRDIWVTTYGGGAKSAVRKLSWNGSSYPSNPTVEEQIAEPGETVIEEGELTRLDGLVKID